jgi:hypothetical protein
MGKFKELVKLGWSRWYVRAGIFAGCLGAQLLIAMAVHLGEPISDLGLSSALYHSREAHRLAYSYAVLGWLLICIKSVGYLVVSPALIVGFLGFSLDAVRNTLPTAEDGRIIERTAEHHSTLMEVKIYAVTMGLLWVLWLSFIQVHSGAFSIRQILDALK